MSIFLWYCVVFSRWTELCPMIEARKNHGLVFVKDKIFAVGGQNGSGTPALVILCMVSQGFMGGFCKEFILL